MKGFRTEKTPSKAELIKQNLMLRKANENLLKAMEQYKNVCNSIRNCETFEKLKEIWEAMQDIKNNVVKSYDHELTEEEKIAEWIESENKEEEQSSEEIQA